MFKAYLAALICSLIYPIKFLLADDKSIFKFLIDAF
jgi:hypothetical protein